jgi:hypothetical protein
MAIEGAAELTTKLVGVGTDKHPPESEIVLSGHATGKRVFGAVLEAAVRIGEYYLLFMTDDVPFEESLGIILLDKGLSVKDSARIGGLYTTGSFSALELCEPSVVRFRFIEDTSWEVRILEKPQLRLPFVSDPPGVYRPFSLTRHFTLYGDPKCDMR